MCGNIRDASHVKQMVGQMVRESLLADMSKMELEAADAKRR